MNSKWCVSPVMNSKWCISLVMNNKSPFQRCYVLQSTKLWHTLNLAFCCSHFQLSLWWIWQDVNYHEIGFVVSNAQTRRAMYRNVTRRHLCSNHCCRGKVISTSYSKCMSVSLVFQHAKRMRRIVICGPSGLKRPLEGQYYCANYFTIILLGVPRRCNICAQ
jgi:hypothetical protein